MDISDEKVSFDLARLPIRDRQEDAGEFPNHPKEDEKGSTGITSASVGTFGEDDDSGVLGED